MIKLKKDNYLQILLFLCFIVLTTAYIIQYVLGFQPCSLCIIERIPYALAIIIILLIINLEMIKFFIVFYCY